MSIQNGTINSSINDGDKSSRTLVGRIVTTVENLNVKGMVKNHNLAKAISDCGWSTFIGILTYKCEREGKILVEVDRFFPSSKICNHCYYQVSEHKLDVRRWTCLSCANVHGRAVNAARNIREKGLRLLALGTSATANGEEVSPKRGRKALVRRFSVKLEAPPSAGGKAE